MELEPCHFIIILNFVQLFINLLSIIATKLCSILNPGLPQVKPGFGFEVVNPGLGYPGSGFALSSANCAFSRHFAHKLSDVMTSPNLSANCAF